jgi:hypothetical protein
LRSGRRSGELTFDETPARLSRMIFNTLQGALLVKRSTDDLSQLQDVIKAGTSKYLGMTGINRLRSSTGIHDW